MGVAYYISTEKELEGVAVEDFGGKPLAHADDYFEQNNIYEAAGVLSLMDFFGDDPRDTLGSEAFDNVPEENLVEKWFEAAEGLRTVAALKKHLEEKPKALKNPKGVLEDLNDLEHVLTICQQREIKWHLSLDI